MRTIELLELLKKEAKEFRKDGPDAIVRNNHTHQAGLSHPLTQDQIDAILVCFINNIAVRRCVDYALYSLDLTD